MDVPHDLVVVSVDVLAIRIPLKQPVRMATSEVVNAENVLVRLTSATGVTGWGEATSAEQTTGERPRHIAQSLLMAQGAIRSLLPATLDVANRIVRQALRSHPAARSAWSIAFHDLVGRHLGVPLYRLLSDEHSSQLMATRLLGHATAKEDLHAAEEAVGTGMRALKLKVGRRSAATEAQLLVEIRKAVGADVILGADANGGLDVETALQLCRLSTPATLDYLEQPLGPDLLADHISLRAGVNVPIAIDESATSIPAIQAYSERGASDGAVLKLQKFGGIEEVVDASRAAHALGMTVAYTGKVAESSIASSALAHVASALGGSKWGLSLTNAYLAGDVVSEALRPVQGRYILKSSPGLGIEVIDSMIDAHRVSPCELS